MSLDPARPLGVIIAGGRSRRFNPDAAPPDAHRDKFRAPFGGTTLLDHIITRARRQLPDLMLNINGPPPEGVPLATIADHCPGQGPLGGIAAAMAAARARGHDHLITFTADSPFFPPDYVARLSAALAHGTVRIAIAESGGRTHPVMGIFDVTLEADARACLDQGARRVEAWIRRHPHEKVVWDDSDPDPFFNINRPEDLARAEQYLAREQSRPKS